MNFNKTINVKFFSKVKLNRMDAICISIATALWRHFIELIGSFCHNLKFQWKLFWSKYF